MITDALRKIFLLTALCCLGSVARAEWHPTPDSAPGEMTLVPMENAPFPHESRAEGHSYGETFFPADKHYSDNSVLLYLSANYRPGPETHLLFYFHGWGNSIEKAANEFRLLEQVSNSGKNVVFVFPEGPKDASDSGLGKLEEEGGIARLAEEVLAKLKADSKAPDDSKLGQVILSGHSGAFRGIARSLRHGGLDDRVSAVFLLDASYSHFDDFTNWIQAHPDHQLFSLFTDHLAPENAQMMARLSKADFPFAVREDTDITSDWLAGQNAVFIVTRERDHNQTVELLETFLIASRLPGEHE
ncbi:MAG: hypothetical protein RLY93_11170 [Sumerlaeia bacterium]